MPTATPIDLTGWDLVALGDSWRDAAPFAHLVIDDFLVEPAAHGLLAAAAEEPCELVRDQIFRFYASEPGVLIEPALLQFREGLGQQRVRDAVEEITGVATNRIDMRAFAYHPGHYLLPHTDRDADSSRALAYTYYLPTPSPVQGGELDLFACTSEGDEIVATRVAATIEPRPNRLVLLDIGGRSLHQVREVTDGVRLSLTGWFYK